MLVLLNAYYHWTPALRRPPAIALYSTPVIRALPPAPSSGGGWTWTGDFTPGRSAGSSTILSCARNSSRSCTTSSCPPGPRSGDSTMT